MMSHALSLHLLLLTSIFSTAQISSASTPPAYTATDLILLNCGASAIANDTSHRSWDGDARSRYMPSNAASISSASEASTMDPSVFPVPYRTARLFHSPFTYTFPLTTGQKFLRLYFYPNAYSDVNATQSLFSLTANSFTLLRNFSAFLHSPSLSRPAFMKEFIVNIGATQRLDLTFTPNPKSSAFINGIEIVSIPDKLYFKGNDVVIKFVDQVYYLNSDTALENLYRLNVGGARVAIEDDSGPTRGMFRGWNPDDDYISFADVGWKKHDEGVVIKYTAQTPRYTAPPRVYTSARFMTNISKSLEWGFPVDSGFCYLLRFHFCEFLQEATVPNDRAFSIIINNQTADIQIDVIVFAGGPDIPVFRDYIIWVPDDGDRGKQDLRLSLVPLLSVEPRLISALLNGLEIFKLNDTKGSFAAANPELTMVSSPPAAPLPPKKNSGGSSVIYAVTGSAIGVAAVLAAVIFLIFRRRRRMKDSATSVTKSSWVPLSTGSRSTARTSGSGISLPSDLCRYFSIDEIRTATRNFDDNFVIGKGGFGNVYKGLIDNAATTVAIKRLNPNSSQGAREFLTEIEMLSKLRHLHLVSLIGYCDDDGEMILVYDYMAHGTLRDHIIHTSDDANSPLLWKQRLQICLGAAKGLDYLHTGAKHAIIHRDVKSTNILLDDKWVAKVSDFGLSKVGPAAGGQTHVSTVVKGSFGYVDPEYWRRQQLTLKSDVYSFGVVLFEVLCARAVINTALPKEQVNLGDWAKLCYRKGKLDQIIDPNLKDQIAPECLSNFAEIAVACLRDNGIDRPSMNDIVWKLEFALQLQVSAESRDGAAAYGDGNGNGAVNPSLPLLGMGIGASNTTTDYDDTFSRSKSSDFSTSSSSEKLKSGDVFSEIINPLGR
ncbi:receptor-like protein kinase FERONIA [Salvia miltiorrhiza]|uniref:receptor-like protein kinase FERONIA n=1 Tax=Salvia miltiorrhiza TaxID=226208 RepID=UPI0025AD0570|nr:receptor-like protein kinase FERONIA [Salvia miltiorrhiza]